MPAQPRIASTVRPAAVAPIRPSRRDRRVWSDRCKLLLDLSLALILFVLTLPLMLLVAVLVKLTSRGPALYSQLRVGRDGKPFLMYKFRTMWHDCEKRSGAQWSRPGDPRVTPLGRFLRASHMDELPQLINVLCGHMSLVGPRPERPEFVPQLTTAIPGYQDRLEVRPGVTGLAQVQLGPDTDLSSVRRKLLYDRWYIEHRSLWLDVRLILCTAMKVFFVPMPICCRFFRIPGAAVVERASRIVKIQPPRPPLPLPEPSDSSEEIPVIIQMEAVR